MSIRSPIHVARSFAPGIVPEPAHRFEDHYHVTCSRTTSLRPTFPAETRRYPARRVHTPNTPVRARTLQEIAPDYSTADPPPSDAFRAAPSTRRCPQAPRLAPPARTVNACRLRVAFQRASRSATTPRPGDRWAEIPATVMT